MVEWELGTCWQAKSGMIILNSSSSPALSLSNCLRGIKERTDIGTGYSEAGAALRPGNLECTWEGGCLLQEQPSDTSPPNHLCIWWWWRLIWFWWYWWLWFTWWQCLAATSPPSAGPRHRKSSSSEVFPPPPGDHFDSGDDGNCNDDGNCSDDGDDDLYCGRREIL